MYLWYTSNITFHKRYTIFVRMEFSSKLLEKAVAEMSQLPGIGKRTALRLVLHLLRQPESQTEHLATSLHQMRTKIKHCKECYNISDVDLCEICASHHRNRKIVCVVEDVHDLKISQLVNRVAAGEIEELIFALSASMEGDTTNFYIYKQLKDVNIQMSTIARGIGVNDEIEFADEITLGRSIMNRIPLENSLKS